MEELKDSIEINVPAEKIFNWFKKIDQYYLDWHKDHVSCKVIKGNLGEVGSEIIFEEYLHGKLHRLKFFVTKIIDNQFFEYKTTFPLSCILKNGAFQIEEKNGTSIFTATLNFRFDKLLKTLVPQQIEDLKIHMKEEGENLKRILEDGQSFKNKLPNHLTK